MHNSQVTYHLVSMWHVHFPQLTGKLKPLCLSQGYVTACSKCSFDLFELYLWSKIFAWLPVYILLHYWEVWRWFRSLGWAKYLSVSRSFSTWGFLWLVRVIRVRRIRFKATRFASSDLQWCTHNKVVILKNMAWRVSGTNLNIQTGE